ncbi:MAG TPA: AraC family transcriptional regulator, partial [Anaerolineales bacterium]|nr:AraC family transcriptional regulator [Anaerolineales bacterium]
TELIINLSERPQFIYDNESLQEIQTCCQGWVSGVRTQPITIPSGKDSHMLIVAFKKGKGFPFYRLPMRELTDVVLEANLVFGRSFDDLREQLLTAKSVDRMFQLVEVFLLRQSGDAIEDSISARCVDYALLGIVHCSTSQYLHQLSDRIGYSQKHFIQLFKDQVGVSPKQYLRIMRFQKAIAAIENHAFIPWSSLALECGFYDQAHFINDFRYFSGFTPNAYVTRKSTLLNYVPVD